MKRTNTLKAAVLGVSLLTLSGVAGSLHASTLVVEPEAMAEAKHDQKAIDVIEKSFDAVGGRELMLSVKYSYSKSNLSLPGGITGTMEAYLHAPDKLFVLINFPMMGEQKQGVNGDITWSSDPMSGPRLLPDDEAKALREETNPATRLNYKNDNPVIEYVGEVDFDGQKAHKIRLVDNDNKESHEYYSVEHAYMIGNEGLTATPMGEIQIISYMREYKEMAGVLQPTKMVQKIGPNEVVITITDVSYDEIDASIFELPAAVQALVKAQKKED